ncbi:hypothetical protein HanXRQr2_Chr09g0393861 [Helianthus annuus]|uniref:Uncharacterized protein n=1 Tax=Helianthus annuus TaxID=4232 RepID=A0A251TWM0_HELAN|nr:hypothetical protein HanXRQr2_Chr09g0393861 [Helianthus annuus]KAJ0542828.1 hypothetical protein HanHA89_Chr09g0344131 [Helianthus annuus]
MAFSLIFDPCLPILPSIQWCFSLWFLNVEIDKARMIFTFNWKKPNRPSVSPWSFYSSVSLY